MQTPPQSESEGDSEGSQEDPERESEVATSHVVDRNISIDDTSLSSDAPFYGRRSMSHKSDSHHRDDGMVGTTDWIADEVLRLKQSNRHLSCVAIASREIAQSLESEVDCLFGDVGNLREETQILGEERLELFETVDALRRDPRIFEDSSNIRSWCRNVPLHNLEGNTRPTL
ncbi:hypothetical protein F52700_2475 [Fusarium sp. NRRL 52700]|nr:hypothetical protein F52700_2475 [Fusarium sp. NRRL 52700]